MSERTSADDSHTADERYSFGQRRGASSSPENEESHSDGRVAEDTLGRQTTSDSAAASIPSLHAEESSKSEVVDGPRKRLETDATAAQPMMTASDSSHDHALHVVISDEPNSASPVESYESTQGMSSLPPDSGSAIGEAGFDDEPTVITERREHSPDSIGRFSTRELGAALVGTQLQHYQLVEFVGGGGMGAVFRANDLKLGRTVAVKVLARTGPNGELAKRFINEAQSAAQLDHENIARVYNVDESGGLSYIVFEFVEGVNLREAVANSGPLSVEQTLRFAIQITEALDHASQRKVIHRDIKPSNILITASGKIKLVDMGLARMSRVDTNDPELTESGMTLGTFDYISPEQARDPRRADIRSDLYSLGCTMYFMLTGKPPFPDGTAFEKLLHHREGKRPDPRRERAEIPSELAMVIRRLMATNPAQRFQTPGELLAALTWMGQKWGLTLTTSPSVERAMARYMARRTWAQHIFPVAVPAIVLALLVVVVELLTERQYPAAELVSPRYASSVAAPDVQDNAVPNDSTDSIPDDEPESNDTRDNERRPNAAGGNVTRGETTRPSNDSSDASSNLDDPRDGGAESGTSSGESRVPQVPRPFSGDSDSEIGGNPDRRSWLGAESGQPTTLSPEPLADVTVEYIRVTRDGNPEIANQMSVKSFSEALAVAGSFPKLKAIRLDFDGEMQVSPQQITQAELAIEAAAGRRPLLRFAPQTIDEQAAMVVFAGERLEWKGIDFVWDLTGGVNPADLTFVRIDQAALLEPTERLLKFHDCTFTVRRVKDNETLVPTEALSLVQVGEPQGIVRGAFLPSRLEPPTIQLERCAVRGSVSLVSTPRATPYTLTWRNGLFMSDRRLIESRGARSKAVPFRATVDLDRVTVASARGLARLTATDRAPEQLELLLNARQCIFEVNEPNALIEHVGVIASPEDLLDFTADRCLIPDRSPIWVMRSSLDPAPTVVYEFEDAIEGDSWFTDKFCERASRVKWDQSPADRVELVSLREIDDYRLLDEPANPGVSLEAGCDPDTLPRFPRLAKLSTEKRSTPEERGPPSPTEGMPEITMPPPEVNMPGSLGTGREFGNSSRSPSDSSPPLRSSTAPAEELPQATMPDMPMPSGYRKEDSRTTKPNDASSGSSAVDSASRERN